MANGSLAALAKEAESCIGSLKATTIRTRCGLHSHKGSPPIPCKSWKRKLPKWSNIWTCNDAAVKARTVNVLKQVRREALEAASNDTEKSSLFGGDAMARIAATFNKNTSAGADGWALAELALFCREDRWNKETLSRFSVAGTPCRCYPEKGELRRRPYCRMHASRMETRK